MKLVMFSVTNYRSITTAHKIMLDNITVLVGRNNEGKSNILKALTLAMTQTIQHSTRQTRRYLGSNKRYDESNYLWERDFPISLQNRANNTETIFKLDFRLDNSETAEFIRETGIRVNGDIPIDIRIGKDNMPKITVPKRGSPAFNKKSEKVTDFISKRIAFNSIEAVRTEYITIDAIQNILYNELSVIENHPEYIEAMGIINKLQSDVLDSIANKIKNPLKEFLPNINDIKIRMSKDRSGLRSRRDIEIIVDDGTPTSIEFKGDGVKSLAALAMLKDKYFVRAASVIAIEEPESHLHPSAIHQLIDVINGLSETNQIIITTHNPLFIYRNNLKANIIVNQGNASPAKSIKEIRDILGVMPSDNLINASYVLVVEGEDDKITLTKLLPRMSDKIKKAMNSNSLVIKAIAGAGNLSYELNTLRGYLCRYFVFLDNDNAGIDAANKAISKGLVTEAEVKYTICNGMTFSEFEDCLEPNVYKDVIMEKFSVILDIIQFRGNSKWSDRLRNTFLSQGQRWSDDIEKHVKLVVAESIPSDPNISLCPHKRSSIDALVAAIENMIK